MTEEHTQGSILDLVGEVPWVWLAACRDCGRPHRYRPAPRGFMTWNAPDGHVYRPRLKRDVLDALMLEHQAGEGP